MLLPLLGACAVVGPFQGPEWEPVRDLLPQDRSCRDPRCCGNLLVFCLFLIWQIQQYWYRVFRTSKKNATKVPPQTWAVSSTRCRTFFGMIPEFFTHGKIRDLDVPVQQWTQKQRWGYRKSLRQQWATQYLLSPQNTCQGLSWVVHTPSEPMFFTSSFSSTCLLPQNNSWDIWQVPWYPNNNQVHPSLEICQRIEQLRAPSQEELVPVEPVSLKYNSTSTALAISPPNFPFVRRSKFCLRGFLPGPLNQQLEPSTKKSLESQQDPLEPQSKTQTVGKGYSDDTPQYTNKRESRREVASEIQAFLPIDFGVEKVGEAKVLGCGNQRLVRETDGEISMPWWEKQDQMGIEDREQTEKVWKKTQREPGNKNPSTQASMGENQEQFRCKTDIATQTPEWGNQEDAMEILALEKENEKEVRGKEEAEAQDQGLETQSWTGSKNSENSQMLNQGMQDQIRNNTGTETEAEDGRNKGQNGSEDGVRENLREVKPEGHEEIQALEKENQGCVRTQNEVQTPAGEMRGQIGNGYVRKTQASEKEDQNLSGHGVQVGIKKLREIREEDWVVLQAQWWGNQRLVLAAVDRGGLKISCWGNQEEVGGEHSAEIQSLESDRGQGGGGGTNNLTPEAENQGQERGKTGLETYPVGSKREDRTDQESGMEKLVFGERNLRGAQGKDEARTQKLGEEDQDQLGNEFHKKIHIPKWKNQEETRGNNSINMQTSEAENWEEITSKSIDGSTYAAGHKEAEKAWGMRLPGGAGGQEERETKAAMEESQSWLGSDMGTNTLLSELNNQKWVGSEDGREVQAPEKKIQGEPGDDDVKKTQRPEIKNQGQFTETEGNRPTRWRSWEQTREEKVSANGALEKENRSKARCEDGRKIQRARRKDQRVLSKVNGKTYLLEWKIQQKFRDGNDAEIQNHGKRNMRNFTGDGGPETQASVGENQKQSVCETDGKIHTRGQRIQSKGRDAAAEIQDVGAQRKCRAEDSEPSHIRRRGDKGQVRRKDAVRPSLQVDSSARVRPRDRKYSLAQPTSLIFRHKHPVAGNGVDSVPCPEEHLRSQGTVPVPKHRGRVNESSQRAQPGTQRRQERDERVDPGKASSLTCQHPHPQSQASSVFPSLLCPQVSQTTPALASVPVVLTTLGKWPALKKSKHLLLESLMKRRIAHLRWGLPRRILESYLLFHFLESCSLPLAGVSLPGSHTDRECQRSLERHCESQGSTLGPESPGRFQSRPILERKSSKLSTQVQALEKCRPLKSEPMGRPIPPKKPRRTRPPGGAREPQIQEEAPKAKMPAPMNPKPAAESRSWCGPRQVQELPTESSRGRKMVRSGVSHAEHRVSSRVRASSCTEGHSHQKKECVPREASEPPRLKCEQPTHGRSANMGPAEGRGACQPPSPCSAHTPSFKEHVHLAAARLNMTFLSKMPWLPQPAKPQHSAPFLTLRSSTPFSKVSAPYTREYSTRVHTALERDPEPPGHFCTEVTVPKTESYQEHETPGKSNRAPRNPAVSQRFGFMRHWRYFLTQCGFKK
ncbi:4930407I10Rik [Phodopus roborovskii]|uniref:4930407I10Rik protein n=1 Tax=Phodopus roborovskii TaxID=109678 RepID=A0AAU9ZGL0_PHORO|nr:4930407I10Rik [Phodopus roborovskii]